MLESSNMGFTCCDWLPNRLILQDEKLLKRIEQLIGSEPVVFLRAREEFQRSVTFSGSLYSDFPIRYAARTSVVDPNTLNLDQDPGF